jgi:hypothetical protein
MIDSPPTKASLSEAHPVTGPERLPPEPQANVLTWIILGAITAAVLLLIIRRRRPITREQTPDDWARRQLSAIASANGDGQSLGEFLPPVIRGYVERRFQISIAGMTTREVATAMRSAGVADGFVAGWCNLLDRCDLAKFARQQFTAAESAETLRRAQSLLSASLSSDESSTAAKTGEFR